MTQEDLSERARISVSFLSMIERGERSPHLETLAALAEALEVRMADLFLDEPDKDGVEPVYRPLLEACRKYNLGKRDVDRPQDVRRHDFDRGVEMKERHHDRRRSTGVAPPPRFWLR